MPVSYRLKVSAVVVVSLLSPVRGLSLACVVVVAESLVAWL